MNKNGDGLGIDDSGQPFLKTGALRKELDWATFYEVAGRPDLVDFSERNTVLRPIALFGGAAAVIGGVALALHGLSLGRQGAAMPGDSGMSLQLGGAASFVAGGLLVQVGAIAIVTGLVIGPDIGSADDNRRIANEHNAKAKPTADPWNSDSAAPPTSNAPRFALHFAPIVTPQTQGAALSLSFYPNDGHGRRRNDKSGFWGR